MPPETPPHPVDAHLAAMLRGRGDRAAADGVLTALSDDVRHRMAYAITGPSTQAQRNARAWNAVQKVYRDLEWLPVVGSPVAGVNMVISGVRRRWTDLPSEAVMLAPLPVIRLPIVRRAAKVVLDGAIKRVVPLFEKIIGLQGIVRLGASTTVHEVPSRLTDAAERTARLEMLRQGIQGNGVVKAGRQALMDQLEIADVQNNFWLNFPRGEPWARYDLVGKVDDEIQRTWQPWDFATGRPPLKLPTQRMERFEFDRRRLEQQKVFDRMPRPTVQGVRIGPR